MAKASVQPPKGTRDFLPLDVRRRGYVTSVIREVFERHGFEPIETPAIERLDALLGKYGEEGDQLLFKVLLRGQPLVEGIREASAHIAVPENLEHGRSGVTARGADPLLADLGLRYDLTVPLARVYAAHQHELPSVWKRYQIQPVWRADTPGKGRYREFYQCDVDVVGSSSLLVEAEVTGAAAECMRLLGFRNFKIRLNHRALLRAIIEHAGIDAALETDAITAIDKLDKVGMEGVAKELTARGIADDARVRLLALLENAADLDQLGEQLRGSEAGSRAIAELRQLLELSRLTHAGEHLRFDVTLARGLGYYTGCIFEIAVPDFGGSLGGGGRYDGLIGMFLGKSVPACGLTVGLERIVLLMAENDMYPATLSNLDLVLGPASEDKLRDALQLANELRGRGLRVSLQPNAISPGKLRKQADDAGARGAAWIEREHQGVASLWLRGGETLRDLSGDRIVELLRADAPPGGA